MPLEIDRDLWIAATHEEQLQILKKMPWIGQEPLAGWKSNGRTCDVSLTAIETVGEVLCMDDLPRWIIPGMGYEVMSLERVKGALQATIIELKPDPPRPVKPPRPRLDQPRFPGV